MLVQGLKGAFFVISGNAFYRYDLKFSEKEQIKTIIGKELLF